MATPEQDRLINELLTGLREIIEERSDRIPGNWDAVELRQWIADVFEENFIDNRIRVFVSAYKKERIKHNV